MGVDILNVLFDSLLKLLCSSGLSANMSRVSQYEIGHKHRQVLLCLDRYESNDEFVPFLVIVRIPRVPDPSQISKKNSDK